jgi:hypothetical protein
MSLSSREALDGGRAASQRDKEGRRSVAMTVTQTHPERRLFWLTLGVPPRCTSAETLRLCAISRLTGRILSILL